MVFVFNINFYFQFEKIFDELAPGMDKVISCRNTGVLLTLCQACKRLSVKQGDFIQVSRISSMVVCYWLSLT